MPAHMVHVLTGIGAPSRGRRPRDPRGTAFPQPGCGGLRMALPIPDAMVLIIACWLVLSF